MTDHGIESTERTPLLSSLDAVLPQGSTIVPSEDDSTSASDDRPSTAQSKRSHDEETGPQSTSPTRPSSASILRIVLVLLIGVFISNADGSLLMATHPIIASEFYALHDSTWLLTSFGLAAAAVQPLYGKLSDIYGRKSLLLLAYTLFGLGCALVGAGNSMSHLIVGRVISGLGACGMTTLVSILLTDLVPLREVASWRSYVNVAATTGRSIGGPLGGWLADTVGWRWSFLGQAPLAGIALILISITLPSRVRSDQDNKRKGSKLARVDFLGGFFMTLCILGFLFPLEIGGDRIPWNHPLIFGLFGGACAFGLLFLATEASFAKEPIIPIVVLWNREVVASSFVMICSAGAQVGLMIAIPLYFKVTAKASNTIAGAHLFPAVAGNAIGGVLSGVIIKRTGAYKSPTLFAIAFASVGYLLLILRWHGDTNWLESLYIVPGGFAMGVLGSTLFIGVQAAIDPAHAAVAASTIYLASSVGMLAGMAGTSAVLQGALRRGLDRRLDDMGFGEHRKWKIIEHAVSDVSYADHAKPTVAKVIVGSYAEALTWTHVLSLSFSLTAFFGSLFLRQHKL